MRVSRYLKKFTCASVLILLSALSLIFGVAMKARAQSSANANNAPTPAATTTPTQSPAASPSSALTTTPSPQPISAPAQTEPTAQPKVIGLDKKRAGLDELITLRVENLPALVHQAKCLGGAPNCQKQELIMFFNGRPLTGEYPEVILPEEQSVQFHLSRSAGNEDLWGDLLGEPTGFTKPIQVSVGLENGYPLPGAQTL